MAHEVPVTQARSELADLVNRVVYGGERVVLTRHGRPVAALVGAADLERLEAADRGDAAEIAEQLSASRPLSAAPPPTPSRYDVAARHHPPASPGSPSSPGPVSPGR